MHKVYSFFVKSFILSNVAIAYDYSTQPSYAPGTMQYQDQKTIDQKYIDHNLDRQREQTQLQQERLENQRLQNQRLENQRWDNQRNDQRVQDRRRDDARRHANNYNPNNQNGIADASDDRMAPTVDKDSEEGRIIDAIKRDLKRDKSLSTNAQNVKISVSNKVVTLTGNVDTKEEKARVESIAKDAFGVRSVNNQLQVVSYDVAPAKK